MIYKCIYIVNHNYKHKNFGRVGAINLEQLNTLLLSLKTYWDYSNNKSLLAELKIKPKQSTLHDYQLDYEL
jgi:hypothetical protein